MSIAASSAAADVRPALATEKKKTQIVHATAERLGLMSASSQRVGTDVETVSDSSKILLRGDRKYTRPRLIACLCALSHVACSLIVITILYRVVRE